MRTPEERIEFCAIIMSAARKCQIGIGSSTTGARFRYAWRDPVSEGITKGASAETKELALESACEALQNHFSPIPA